LPICGAVAVGALRRNGRSIAHAGVDDYAAGTVTAGASTIVGTAAVALTAVDVLFLVFVLVQLRFLFGGRGLVESSVGLTYAEYARHGFFELVVVAVLVLPLVLGTDAVLKGTPREVRLVRASPPI
jgi:Domain of unknown function (DUF4153)